MDIYVYSDESGVFDKEHNDIYVFGGVIFLSKEDKDIQSRKYRKVEKDIRKSGGYERTYELKACKITNKEKNKIFRSLNNCIKFGAVIIQNKVSEHIFNNKKTKQRYLDYVYKIALKRTFEQLITQSIINPNDVNNIYVYTDEHTTANDGRYELHEALEIEFKIGTTNYVYMTYFPPIFKNIKNVDVKFLNSSSVTLIRAADIVANNIFYKATKSFRENKIVTKHDITGSNIYVIIQP